MRLPLFIYYTTFIAALGCLSACGMMDSTPTAHAVDPAQLPPLTGREQALMVGADGAARNGNTDAAEHDYLSAIAASTGHVDAHLALARLYQKSDQLQKERDVLERALVLQPNHPLVNYMLGKLDLAQNRNREAREAFQRGRKSTPSDLDLMNGEAIATDLSGDHAAAQTLYLQAINLHPQANLADLRTNLAMSYLFANQPKRAVDILRDEAKKSGASVTTRQDLALAYGMLGKNTEARALVHGEMSEEERQLALARLKEYISERHTPVDPVASAPLKSSLTPVAPPVAAPSKIKTAPLVQKSPTPPSTAEYDHNLDGGWHEPTK